MPINWQQVIITVFTTVGGGGVLLGAAAYLIKTALTHRLAHEAETFKTRLKADADSEIERLKHSLQITALEHQVRFSKLHERRAEVIAELYKRLVEVYEDGRLYVLSTSGSKRPEQLEHYNGVTQKSYDLIRFVDANRIYIPLRACELLDRYILAIRTAVIDIHLYRLIEYPNPQTIQDHNESFRKALIAVEQDIPQMKKVLDQEFRVMLGEMQGSKAT